MVEPGKQSPWSAETWARALSDELLAAAMAEKQRRVAAAVVVVDDPYRKAAEAAGWRHGGEYIYDSNVFGSWKEAVSWSGEDGRDEAEQSSNLYSTWRECCAGEDIEVAV